MPSRRLAFLTVALLLAPAGAGDDYLRYLPDDTKVVVRINFANLPATERANAQSLFDKLYRTYLAPELGKDARLPLSDCEHVVFALPYAGSINGLLLMRGKLDAALLDKQLRDVAKSTGSLSTERVGKPPLTVYSRRLDEAALVALVPPLEKVPGPFRKLVAPQAAHVCVLDDHTICTSLAGKKPLERAIRARAAARVRIPDELAAPLRKQDAKDLVSTVLLEQSLHPGISLVADEATNETFRQFDAITSRVVPGKEVKVVIDVLGKSADDGPPLEAKMKRALEEFGKLVPTLFPQKDKRGLMEALVKSFRVERADGRVTLTGRLADDDWRKLIAP